MASEHALLGSRSFYPRFIDERASLLRDQLQFHGGDGALTAHNVHKVAGSLESMHAGTQVCTTPTEVLLPQM